ncbi:magnesium chelatase [Sphaerisporangium siamense]|uniref:Magnesium chelatase subunit D n=1 Tax=Sphaerisporangium siamense TaxID=795645 RepID=A0A7W7D7B5_9ACTN|nr:hypothetical protein [Sphaerisporangium siamense]MBB4701638.1 magnesium chelatase subunit D [Sphaerisporangium siamense]GII85763.1 magnesium chelatase [Sphaerisporangium siamense]
MPDHGTVPSSGPPSGPPSPPLGLRERVATGLACAAVEPGLAGILLFDLDADVILPVVHWFAGLAGVSPTPVMLGATTTDDDLWVRIRPYPGEAGGFRLERGPLVGEGRAPRVVVVPDLARLGAAGARAALASIGADVTHLERTGVQARWRPRDHWIACCRRDEVGRVSPHLLDRFALRLDAAGLKRTAGRDVLDEPDPQWRRAVRAGRVPGASRDAVEAVVAALSPAGPRRDLALGRVARALAALRDDSVVEREHVEQAAHLTGVFAAARQDGPRDPAQPSPSPAGAQPDARQEPGPRPVEVPAGEATPLPSGPLPAVETPREPYPEDHADPDHDAYPLRLPPYRRAGGGPARGHPIGTRPARDLKDIAVAATLLEAAKFQAVRREERDGSRRDGDRLLVEPVDLRGHRRAPRPGSLLLLLLDHTCHRGWDWYEPLAPYLRWAYAARAPVAVVEVGAADAPDELRAEMFAARGVLDPRVATAMERLPGRATPLAHGLTLAGRALRHGTRQGDAAIVDALLVVVTDGRANVPLAAGLAGRMPERVAAEGVVDAVEAARRISTLRRVRSVVIDPGPRPGAYLTAALAAALGGTLVPGVPDDPPHSTAPDEGPPSAAADGGSRSLASDEGARSGASDEGARSAASDEGSRSADSEDGSRSAAADGDSRSAVPGEDG